MSWSSKRGGGTYGNPWNRSSWNHGGNSIYTDDGNDNSSGERQMKAPANNFIISVSNDVANNYQSPETTEPSDWVFGQTEWSRLWVNKCFQSVIPSENPKETNPPPSSTPRSFPSKSPVPRGNKQNQSDRVARLSCWDRDSRNEFEEKVSIKSRLGNGGGPMRRLNDAKVRRDRSVPIYGQDRRMHSAEAQNSQKEYGACRIRRSPPHVVPSHRGAVRPSDPKAEPKEWDLRQHLRKLRFEKNATVSADPVNMALEDLIAVKKNLKNSKNTSPLGKASCSGDPKIGDGTSQLKDRRSFNSKIEQPINRLGRVPEIVKTASAEGGKMVIVDGSSVAFEYGDQIYFDWEGINACIKRLIDFGYKRIKVVVPEDKLGKGMSKNNHYVEELQKKGFLLPCRENQNYKQMMLNVACKKDAIIISNDVGKKTKLPGSGVPKDAVEKTSRFIFKARGPSRSIEFLKIPDVSNEVSLEEALRN